MTKKNTLVFINMASKFGGGEFQTEQLILSLQDYNIYFFGKNNSPLQQKLRQHLSSNKILNFTQLIKLAWSNKNIIIHAQDGRGAHIAGLLKYLFGSLTVITRHVDFPLKRKSSQYAYKTANALVGVSNKISHTLSILNTNTITINNGIKPLIENIEFENNYFISKKNTLKIAHVGNLQPIKNFPLTIELAKQNPEIHFYLVGSGELQEKLQEKSSGLNNITYIPFTQYIGSVFKHIDIQIMPSHSEGSGSVILEGYQYQVPVLAHSIGGIPEIVEDGITGYLSENNRIDEYQTYLNKFKEDKNLLPSLKENIFKYTQKYNFSTLKMASEYNKLYQKILTNVK